MMLKESTHSADNESEHLKQCLLNNWKQLILGAVHRGELSEGLAPRNIDDVVNQLWKDTQAVIDHTWDQAQDAYQTMASEYPR